MHNLAVTLSTPALAVLLMSGMMTAVAPAADLSQYRGFKLGSDLALVSERAAMNPSQAKVIFRRPVLLQELAWRPQLLGRSAAPEAVYEVVFSFYAGELFQIAVDYDRNETEGLTAADFVGAISAIYGTSEKPTTAAVLPAGTYASPKEILGQWQDSDYRFELIRSRYGAPYRLVGVLKILEAPVLAATLEAKRLEDREAPQKEAARLAGEAELANAKLEKARLINQPKFRP